jgi:hypothetical protein
MIHDRGAHWSSYVAIPMGIFATIVTTAACASKQAPPSPPPSSAAPTAPDRYGATMMQPSDQATGQAVRVAASPLDPPPTSDAQLATLDDAHLAGLIEEVDDGVVRLASAGERRATDHQVKRFAHDIAAKHLAATSGLRARFSQLGLQPASGPVSEQARVDVGGDLATLPSAKGQDFDRAYVDGQRRELARAAELVGRIMGHVESPEFADALEQLRSRLAADVRGARSLDDSLRKGTTNERPDAYDPDKSRR